MNARTLINPNAIPRELWPYKQFVCWRYRDRGPDKKPDKVPVNCHTLGNAGVNWPNTWFDIYTSVAVYAANPGLAGIGFVLTNHDPYVMVDIDHCLSDGALSPFASEIVDRLNTYTENSPSGHGLRLFVHCEQQPHALKRDEIEIYSKQRWATLTGNVLHARPIARVDNLDWLLDRFPAPTEQQQQTHTFFSQVAPISQDDAGLWERMFHFNRLAKPLFDGDTSVVRGNPNESPNSRAVILLLNALAKWTGGDAGRMRNMMAQTRLDKTKWGERRGGSDWLDYQIDNAIKYMGGR